MSGLLPKMDQLEITKRTRICELLGIFTRVGISNNDHFRSGELSGDTGMLERRVARVDQPRDAPLAPGLSARLDEARLKIRRCKCCYKCYELRAHFFGRNHESIDQALAFVRSHKLLAGPSLFGKLALLCSRSF